MAKPELRFPEFTDEWKEYKINEIFERIVKPVEVEKNKKYRQIGIRSHGKGLFYKDEVTGEELGNKRVFWIEPNCFVVNIVFAWERAVAKLTEAERGMIASHRFPMYKPKNRVLDLDYITEYFITTNGQKILVLASPGGAGRNKTLGQNEFLNSKIVLPSYNEQKKIANALFAINDLIQIQEKEIIVLEEQKKGVAQKIFSQEVRFKTYDGNDYPEWEEKTVKECLEYEQPTKYIVSSEDYNDEYDVPVLTANKGFVLGYTNEKNGVYDKGNAIIYDDFTMDTKYVTFKFKVKSSAMKILTTKGKLDLYYVFSYLQNLNLHQSEHARSYISKVEPMNIYVPCIEEQKKISDCLLAYDEAIQIKKDKLETWKEIKKGLLQQMFV